MKVLLINPTFTTRLPKFQERRPPLAEPLGLAYLAAVSREAGHETIVLDCYAEGWQTKQREGELTRSGLRDDEIAARLRDLKPDLIGITCQFTGFDRDCRRIAALAKQVLPDVPVVVGGADATMQAQKLVEDPSIDLVVRGEGETTFVALLEYFAAEHRLPNDLDGTTVPGAQHDLPEGIQELDSLPLPARDLLPMQLYLEDQTPLFPFAKRFPVSFVFSSRGCPCNCVFCSTKNVWGSWRPRSPENVVDEIERVVNDYGVREIAFQDDSFLAWPKRVMRICEELLKRKIDITWSVPPGLSVWVVTEELLHAMCETGFYRACFPIESGDPAILEYIRKNVDLNRVLETVALCQKMGLWTYGNFIIGFPEQTVESIEMTTEFAVHSGLDMINVYVAQPYAGAEMYDQFAALGLLDRKDAAGSTVFHSQYDTVHFKAEELRALRDQLFQRFLKERIRRVFTLKGMDELRRKIRTPENFRYAMRVFGLYAKNSIQARKVSLFN